MLTSTSNNKVKHATRVRENKEPGCLFVEGDRLMEDLVKSGWPVDLVFHGENLSPRGQAVLASLQGHGVETTLVAPSVLQSLSDTVSSQGLIAIARRPEKPSASSLFADRRALVVILDAVQDPGNVGTIIRTAEAAGATGVILLEGSADPYSTKALRASMGSTFRMQISRGSSASDIVAEAREHGVTLLAAAGTGETLYSRAEWLSPCALILGNEANGVSDSLMAASDHRVRIPLHGGAESLNAAAAAAVLLFEAARQRAL